MPFVPLGVLLMTTLHCLTNAANIPETGISPQTDSVTEVNAQHMVLPTLLELGLRGSLRTWLSMPSLKNTTGKPFPFPGISPIEEVIEALKTAFQLGELVRPTPELAIKHKTTSIVNVCVVC